MPRSAAKLDELAMIEARRGALRTELATLDKSDAKSIASAISNHGGQAVARHLASLVQLCALSVK